MTRFAYDEFAKDFLEELLSPLGEVKAPLEVRAETRQVDVWFAPSLEGEIKVHLNFEENQELNAFC
jgi:hypothetical protein